MKLVIFYLTCIQKTGQCLNCFFYLLDPLNDVLFLPMIAINYKYWTTEFYSKELCVHCAFFQHIIWYLVCFTLLNFGNVAVKKWSWPPWCQELVLSFTWTWATGLHVIFSLNFFSTIKICCLMITYFALDGLAEQARQTGGSGGLSWVEWEVGELFAL